MTRRERSSSTTWRIGEPSLDSSTVSSSSIPPERAGSALGRALLFYLSFVVILITWAPFRFGWPTHPEVITYATVDDVIINLALFFPLGFLFSASFARGSSSRRSVLVALGFGLLFSTIIEVGQLLIEARHTSPWDVLANMVGAGIGAVVHTRFKDRLDAELGERLALELPLMNVVYLLSMLLLIDALCSVGQGRRALVSIVLALCGSRILGSIWRHRLHRSMPSWAIVLIVTGWFLVMTLPALFSLAWALPVGAVFTALATWVETIRGPVEAEGTERRFELPVLRRTARVFAVYLVLLSLWPLTFDVTPWRGEMGLSGFGADPSIGDILRFLELIGAYTLGGFMLAEARGRRARTLGSSVLTVSIVASLVSLVLEGARGFHSAHHASLIQLLATIGSAVVGAALYHLQLGAVRTWLKRRAT